MISGRNIIAMESLSESEFVQRQFCRNYTKRLFEVELDKYDNTNKRIWTGDESCELTRKDDRNEKAVTSTNLRTKPYKKKS